MPATAGNQKLCITSADSMSTATSWPSGTCISLAVVTPRSGYWNSHHHWCPITFTCTASPGGFTWVFQIVSTVGTATSVRITAGASVQAISSAVLPWTWAGSGAPGRLRKRTTATSSRPSTITKITTTQKVSCRLRVWIQPE